MQHLQRCIQNWLHEHRSVSAEQIELSEGKPMHGIRHHWQWVQKWMEVVMI